MKIRCIDCLFSRKFEIENATIMNRCKYGFDKDNGWFIVCQSLELHDCKRYKIKKSGNISRERGFKISI